MDNNQNTTPNPVVPPPQNPMPPPVIPPPPPETPATQAQGSSIPPQKPNDKIIPFIVVGVLLLILLGAIYFIAQRFGSQNQPAQITPIPTQALPTSTPTPTPLSEKDIDTIDLGSPEADLKGIDEDVKQL